MAYRYHTTYVICCAKCNRGFETEETQGECPHCGQIWEYRPLPRGYVEGNGREKGESNGNTA